MRNLLLPLVTLLFHLNASAQVPTLDLMVHMPFNGNAVDETGNGNDGTVVGPNLTTDRFGNANAAYEFDGMDDRLDIFNNNLVTDSSATINFWIAPGQNWNSASDYQILFQSDPGGDISGHFIIGFNRSNCFSAPSTDDGKINFELQGDFTNNNSVVCNAYGLTRVGTTTTSWTASTWYMITAIVNEGQIRIYVDGQLEGTHPCTSGVFVAGEDIMLGSYVSPQPLSLYAGKLDDIRIYSRALIDQEIASLYDEFLEVEQLLNAEFELYPNPASDQITVAGDNLAGKNLVITDAMGRKGMEQRLPSNESKIDVSTISSEGLYLVQIFDETNQVIATERLIIK
ncbi:MAG: T9SS type A sorting domain-containing protein [bacterium]|nr:T9SS type A sorting domain-containing protein [bacterium]